jgi:hypothetical protein
MDGQLRPLVPSSGPPTTNAAPWLPGDEARDPGSCAPPLHGAAPSKKSIRRQGAPGRGQFSTRKHRSPSLYHGPHSASSLPGLRHAVGSLKAAGEGGLSDVALESPDSVPEDPPHVSDPSFRRAFASPVGSEARVVAPVRRTCAGPQLRYGYAQLLQSPRTASHPHQKARSERPTFRNRRWRSHSGWGQTSAEKSSCLGRFRIRDKLRGDPHCRTQRRRQGADTVVIPFPATTKRPSPDRV